MKREELLAALEGAADSLRLGRREVALGTAMPALESVGRHEWEDVFSELVRVSKEPRDGMLTYDYAIGAVSLPSGRRAYGHWGDTVDYEFELVGVGRDETVDEHFLQRFVREGDAAIDLPLSIYAGDELFEIDLLWTLAEQHDWILYALTDTYADWVQHSMIEFYEAELTRREEELEEQSESGELDEESIDDAYEALETLRGAPGWFLALDQGQLEQVAGLPLPQRDRKPPLRHKFKPWQIPTAEMFDQPEKPPNMQHIASAYLIETHLWGPSLPERSDSE